jgi:Copper binding proteins, plastocyanin/azurin family
MNNKRGTPNGIFDSGSFKPGKSWTHTFNNPGTYTYFCTIHPWMEGRVTVQDTQAQKIPNYPVESLVAAFFYIHSSFLSVLFPLQF